MDVAIAIVTKSGTKILCSDIYASMHYKYNCVNSRNTEV